jgi:S-adenosylmethionine decarboxylase
MKELGIHNLIELYGCEYGRINKTERVESFMVEAALESGATVVDKVFHQFSPHGISGVVIISESHLAIHTWPEFGYAAVDVFTCGDTIDHARLQQALIGFFQAKSHTVTTIFRGIPDHGNDLTPNVFDGDFAPSQECSALLDGFIS